MKNIKKSTMVPLLCEKKKDLNSEIKLKEKVCLLNLKKTKMPFAGNITKKSVKRFRRFFLKKAEAYGQFDSLCRCFKQIKKFFLHILLYLILKDNQEVK